MVVGILGFRVIGEGPWTFRVVRLTFDLLENFRVVFSRVGPCNVLIDLMAILSL